VHANRTVPPSAARYVEASVPDDISFEVFDPAEHPGWDEPFDTSIAQAFGRTWIEQGRTALLIVPSIVTGGLDTNVVVNPDHPDAARISVSVERPVALDPRLFHR
jgi:RES domain-containing protein